MMQSHFLLADGALPAPAWDFWAVLGTAAVGALIALVIDFLLKPRLQVRTERFTQRAKDKVELERIVRSMYINAVLMIAIPSDLPDFAQEKLRSHQESIRSRLFDQTLEMQEAYSAAAPHLPAPILRLLELTGGLVQGSLWSGCSNVELKDRVSPQLGLLYDVLATPKTKFIGYRHHLGRVKRFIADPHGEAGREALKPT